MRRSPDSTLATQLCGTLSTAANWRWESPALVLSDNSLSLSFPYSGVCVDLRIAPMIGPLDYASKFGTLPTMLALPVDWRDFNADYLATHLLEQAQVAGMYHSVASLMTRACLEQLVESRGWDKRPDPLVVTSRRYGFRIGGGLFYVLAQIDDEAMATIPKLARMGLMTTVLVPPWSSRVARECLASLPSGGHVHFLSLNTYVSLRICFTTMDLRIPDHVALFRLFSLYNVAARSCGVPANLIRIPIQRNSSPSG